VEPVLFAVDEDERALDDVERELVDRYSRGYRVVCVSSAGEAMVELQGLKEAGKDVALVLAAQSLERTTGSELLGAGPLRRSSRRWRGGRSSIT
jgi:hypothetical protein